MNAIAKMLVTTSKTPLNDTQIPSPMETIRTILRATIELYITSFLFSIIINELREFRTWAKGQGEEDPQDPQK